MRFLPDTLTRSVSRAILKSKKNSPHIFFVAGVAGAVTSTVLACRATLKLEETLDEIHEEVKGVKSLPESLETQSVQYTERDHYRDLVIVYGRGAVQMGRLYGPSILVGVAAIGALTGSHIQMTKRNAALASAFAMLTKSFEDYRERVQTEIGLDRELEIYNDAQEGETKVVGKKKAVMVPGPNGGSIYSVLFDSTNQNWVNDPGHNRAFLNCQQKYANDYLRGHGHIFLNQVYESLGFPHTQAGALVGWVWNGEGDNYVDFDLYCPENMDFINENDRVVRLDFNVDGIIYDKI